MSFDWKSFLSSRRIEWIDRGANIYCKCPWCGQADPSAHMGISEKGKGWGCLRNNEHRGRSQAKLVAALIGCSFEQACKITGQEERNVPEDYMGGIDLLLKPPLPKVRPPLTMPIEFKSFAFNSRAARPFFLYLNNRGYRHTEITEIADAYDLRYARDGLWAFRIVFLVKHQGKLVTWTGRSINGHPLRYKAHTADPEKAALVNMQPAVGPITDFLLWYDELIKLRTKDADTIVLCEGPFDALKVRMLGRARGIVSTCFFTTSPSRAQIELLHELLPRFQRRVLLLDQGTQVTSERSRRALSALGVDPMSLPDGLKDPGEATSLDFLR